MPVMGALAQMALYFLRQATNGTYECSRSLFYAQSASVTSQLAEIVRVVLTGKRYVSAAFGSRVVHRANARRLAACKTLGTWHKTSLCSRGVSARRRA